MPPDAPYRDDREADRARIAALESELDSAKDKIAELEGRQSQALVLAGGGGLTVAGQGKTAAAKWFGAPMRLDLTRSWDKAFPTDKFEDLLEPIRAVAGERGRVELLKSSMTWWSQSESGSHQGVGPRIEVRITVRNGTTRLDVSDRLHQLAGVIFGAIGGGMGGGMIALPIFASIAVPVLAPVIVLGWLGTFFGGTRAIFKSRAKKRAVSLQRLFDTMCAAIDEQLKTAG